MLRLASSGSPGGRSGGPHTGLYFLSPVLFLLWLVVWSATSALGSTPSDEPSESDPDSVTEYQDQQYEYEEPVETGRSFLYKEAVVSLSFLPGDPTLSHRPPGSYLALDYVRTFTADSKSNRKLPGWLQVTAMDLHPRLIYFGEMPAFDPDSMMMMEEDSDWPMPVGDEAFFAPQDFWVRFRLAGRDRLTLKVGQIILPYGVNPPMAPRQTFILPVEAMDLGLKWDWGLGLKGPLGQYDWELAATFGTGEVWRTPESLGGSRPSSHLFTGRIGTATYRDLQYGLSFLVGDLPVLHGPFLVEEDPLSRWRTSLDVFYKIDTYLTFGGQVTYGQNGYDGDEELVRVNGGTAPATVLGYRGFLDWVPRQVTDLRVGFQVESLTHDLDTPLSDESAAIFEAGYSLTTEITLKLSFREVFRDFMGGQEDALYFTLIYYGR